MPRPASVVIAAVMVGMLMAGCAGVPAAVPTSSSSSTSPSVSAAPSAAASTPPAQVLEASAPVAALAPVSVSISSIELAVPLIDLGIAADGSMEVPADYSKVGWFTGGGRPGGFGPTVIAGHVDSPTGPAVFIRLSEVREGDEIEVLDAGGTAHRYVVTAVADYPKSSFPTQRVFGAVADDELRLITCGGVFDREAASYVDNRVVFASRVP